LVPGWSAIGVTRTECWGHGTRAQTKQLLITGIDVAKFEQPRAWIAATLRDVKKAPINSTRLQLQLRLAATLANCICEILYQLRVSSQLRMRL
jgi:hypothetical protein